MDWFKLFDWNQCHHFSLQFNLECPIAVRFMQELDHQFFMPVFWMSCCEGRLGANILTNKCIIWGLEPGSVACPIFMSLSLCLQSTPSSESTLGPGRINKELNFTTRVKTGISLIYSDHIVMIGTRCLVWWITLLFPLTLIIHHLMLAQ